MEAYIPYLLKELSSCASRLVVVVNGRLDMRGKGIFSEFTDEVFVRENTGYDAGAYRYILAYKLKKEELDAYEEVVLCNDTFFGPVEPFERIFDQMECSDCDFWGLYGYFDVVFTHIQSYFLVFRKPILEKGLLTEYFREYIDETTVSLREVYGQFELGLFDFLVRQKGMRYDCYARRAHVNVYSSSYLCMKEYGLPIVKKKVFSDLKENSDNVWCTLSYIKYETDYDVGLILDYLYHACKITVQEQEIKRPGAYGIPVPKSYPRAVNGEKQIEEFLYGSTFYIYGAGDNGSKAYWRFAREMSGFLGFLVSDGMTESEHMLYGYPVRQVSQSGFIPSDKILVATEKQYADEIMKSLHNVIIRSQALRIF